MSAVKLPKGELYQGKYNIYDPSQINFKERTDFLKSLHGLEHTHTDAIESLLVTDYTIQMGHEELVNLAHTYNQLKARQARLPKFSKWVLGMFNTEEFKKQIAALGQKTAERKVRFSIDVVDILRCSATTHFASCFNLGRGSERQSLSPVYLAEESAGTGIIFSDDDQGFMKGRAWVHHVKLDEGRGEDAVLLVGINGNVNCKAYVDAFASKGVRTFASNPYTYPIKTGNEKAKLVGGYDVNRYHDYNLAQKGVITIYELK